MSLMSLEKRGALQILAYLYKKGRSTITEFRKNVKAATDTLYSSLELLGKMGLVKRVEEKEFPFSTFYELTPLGHEVAELLARIEELLRQGGRES
mgnify:CR=1 FL=1